MNILGQFKENIFKNSEYFHNLFELIIYKMHSFFEMSYVILMKTYLVSEILNKNNNPLILSFSFSSYPSLSFSLSLTLSLSYSLKLFRNAFLSITLSFYTFPHYLLSCSLPQTIIFDSFRTFHCSPTYGLKNTFTQSKLQF